MFIGHFAVGLAAKKAAPKTSLGTLFLAVQFADLLWPLLLLLGLERVEIAPGNTVVTPLAFVSYPISHSLLTDLGWATLVAGLYLALKRYWRGTLWVWIGVLSHWFLDALVHRPDLPLYPGGVTLVGLGLWNSLPDTLVTECGMFAVCLALYLKTTRAKDKLGVYAFWMLMTVLILSYLGAIFGPPPPGARLVAITALLMWLFIPWAYWVDRHREVLPRSVATQHAL